MKTAVEHLSNRLASIDWGDPFYRDMLEEAKKLEREQLLDAGSQGYLKGYNDRVKEEPKQQVIPAKCDVCGRTPYTIYKTEFGTFCYEHKRL